MSSDKLKLCLIRMHPGKGVSIFTAPLPAAADGTVTFTRPIKLDLQNFGDIPTGEWASIPFFDFTGDGELLWICHRDMPGKEGAYQLPVVWHIEKYLRLGNTETVSAGSSDMKARYGFRNCCPAIVDGKTTLLLQTDYRVGNLLRRDEKGWTDTELYDSWGNLEPSYHMLRAYQPYNAGLAHFYIVGSEMGDYNYVRLASVPAKRFSQNKPGVTTIRWDHFRIKTGFETRQDRAELALVALSDEQGAQHRLYIFRLYQPRTIGGWKNFVDYCWVPLRKDGSIASYDTEVTAQESQSMSQQGPGEGGRNLSLIVADKQLSIIWNDMGLEAPIVWFSGPIGTDGRAPKGDAWVQMKHNIKKDSEGQYYYAGVVSDDFV